MNKFIGENLRLVRQHKGLTQKKVGEILDLTFQQIQKYEAGRDRLPAASVKILSDALNVPIGAFYGEVDEVPRWNTKAMHRVREFMEISEEGQKALLKAYKAISEKDNEVQLIPQG